MSHHALAPAGDQAQAIATLWHALFWTNAVIYVAVLAALAWALWRPRTAASEAPEARAGHVRGWMLALMAWTAFIAIVLVAFTIASFVQDRRLLAREPDALRVRITGKQWYWQVEYLDPDPSRRVTTANELHLPVGRMARIELQSDDVIHSLWIPSLNGKRDAIPGRTTELAVTPRREGRYLGECAEFCGVQHAHMALPVTVESPERFAAWYEARLAPPVAPTSAAALRGQAAFESGPCAMCHAIAGTSAGSRIGPDLTHFASRPTIAAGALPNDAAHLDAWLAEPQRHKPGSQMPNLHLAPATRADLVAYLEGLK